VRDHEYCESLANEEVRLLNEVLCVRGREESGNVLDG
jgi:hypothetical protein